jgi:hypothetical protein
MRALRVSVTGALAAFAVSCLAVPVPALGLEPGVHADPGSPAAKEYALPLNQARRTGGPPTNNEGSSTGAPFGAGIKPPGSGRSGGARSSVGNNPHGARRGASGAVSSDVGTPVPAIVLRAASSRASGGDGSLLTLLGGAVVVLILGAFGGTIMRRNHRSSVSA